MNSENGPIDERSQSATRSNHSRDPRFEHIAQVLEFATEQFGLQYERAAIRRAVGEAIHTWPGTESEKWWKWLCEAGYSLRLQVAVVDESIDEALRLLDEGIRLIVYSPAPENQWRVFSRRKTNRYEVLTPLAKNRQRLSRRQLRRVLEGLSVGGTLRVATAEPTLSCAPGKLERDSIAGEQLSPFARFILIIRPEWSDIWVLLVFSLLAGILTLAMPMAVQVMVSLVAFGRFLQPVIILSLMLAVLLISWSALRLWEIYIAEILERRLFARVVHDLSVRLPRVQQSAIDGQYGPELVNRFFDVVTLQKVTTKLLLDAIDLAVVVIIGMIVLAVYHPLLLGLDLSLVLSIGFIVFGLGRGGVPTSIQESKYKYKTAAWLQELMRCPMTFKLDESAEYASSKAEHLVSNYLESRRLHFRVVFRQILFALGLYAVAGSLLLGVGGWLVIKGQLTLGQLVASEMIVATIVGAFTKMGKHLTAFYDLMAGVDKLGVLFDLPMERQHGLMRLPELQPAELSVRDVTFGYDQTNVLDRISFTIQPRDRILLTGSTGCGKSTLADLLYGLREPLRGRILLDGHDLMEVRPDVWRRHVMLIRQPEVFHASIVENIHMDHPDLDVRLVRDACDRLGLLESDAISNGLETTLSSEGAPLSDTQLGLLALARAIVHQPRLLIIDGLLDTMTPDALEKAMDVVFDAAAPWTLIVVSSDPQVAERCNRQLRISAEDSTFAPC